MLLYEHIHTESSFLPQNTKWEHAHTSVCAHMSMYVYNTDRTCVCMHYIHTYVNIQNKLNNSFPLWKTSELLTEKSTAEMRQKTRWAVADGWLWGFWSYWRLPHKSEEGWKGREGLGRKLLKRESLQLQAERLRVNDEASRWSSNSAQKQFRGVMASQLQGDVRGWANGGEGPSSACQWMLGLYSQRSPLDGKQTNKGAGRRNRNPLGCFFRNNPVTSKGECKRLSLICDLTRAPFHT